MRAEIRVDYLKFSICKECDEAADRSIFLDVNTSYGGTASVLRLCKDCALKFLLRFAEVLDQLNAGE